MKGRNYKVTALLLSAFLLCFPTFGCAEKGEDVGVELPKLVIGGATHEPYFFKDGNGVYTGIDVEVATIACQRIGYEPVFKEIEWICKDELLQEGEIDCIWKCFSMNGRENDYRWAGPYAGDKEVVAVLKNSDIRTLQDLEGKSVAVQMTSNAENVFLSGAYPHIPKLKNVFCLHDINESISALRREYVDACAGHEAVLIDILEELSIDYRILEEPILYTEMGVAFDLANTHSAYAALHNALKEMKNDGSIRSIFDAYGTAVRGV